MASKPKKIFIHSSVLIAYIDRGSANHLRASKLIDDMAAMGCRLYTSTLGIGETYDKLVPQVGITVALEFLQVIFQSNIEILFPQKSDLITAYRILKTNRNEKLSFIEALKATLMQRKGIDQVLTFGTWNQLFGITKSQLAV